MPSEAERLTRFHSVTPRMVVNDVKAAIELLRAVFDGTGEVQADRPPDIGSIIQIAHRQGREPGR